MPRLVVLRIGNETYRGENRVDALCVLVGAFMKEMRVASLPFDSGMRVVTVEAEEEEAPAGESPAVEEHAGS